MIEIMCDNEEQRNNLCKMNNLERLNFKEMKIHAH